MNGESKAILLPQGYPIIEEVTNLILEEERPEELTVITPSRRSTIFLSHSLSEKKRVSILSPKIFAIEDYINFMYERYVSQPLPLLSHLDAVYFIHKANKETKLIENEELDFLLPWAFKLYSDFEELYIENVAPHTIKEIDTLIFEEKIPPNLQKKLSSISKLYSTFYESINQRFSTRAVRYVKVSELKPDIFKGKYILFGFYALSVTEKKIFENIFKSSQVIFVAHKSNKIEKYLKSLHIPITEKSKEENEREPEYHIIKTSSIHQEIFTLKSIINEKNAHTKENVIVLPNESNLLAVANNITSPNKNISAGYPLIRTPFFSLISFIEELISTKEDEKFLKNRYLNVILHPYIKNTRFKNTTVITRILMHTIEEELKRACENFISLDEVEKSDALKITQEKIKNVVGEVELNEIVNLLKNIHQITIRSFESISNVGNFIEKVIALANFISSKTTAGLHPLGNPFMEATLSALLEMKDSLLKDESLVSLNNYFILLKNYIKTKKVPFKGTPLKGLQILGSLETRNLNFKRVFYLDVNEGIVPGVKKEDSILSDYLRRLINLPTAKEREEITRHYFFNLIKGAEEVYLFYTTDGLEPSRYIEMLKWQREKKEGKIGVLKEEITSFNISFSYREPKEVKKTEEIIRKLKQHPFSATQLNTYLKCPLRFYYENFLIPEETKEISSAKSRMDIGNIIHSTLKEYFEKWKNKELYIENLEEEKNTLFSILNKHFPDTTGNEVLIQKEQVKYALNLLLERHVKELNGIKITHLEEKFKGTIELDNGEEVQIEGRIDRVHEYKGNVYIIDYKTGSLTYPMKDKLPTKEDRENWDNIIKSFQLPFYIMLYHHNNPNVSYEEIEVQIWSLKEFEKDGKTLKVKPFLLNNPKKQKTYEDALKTVIEEILNPSIPFMPVSREKAIKRNVCKNCPYNALCDRLWTKGHNKY